ncbi:MAG TPA: LysR family transcriptional regulator [Propionibacteriaceae bacterium]|nr:LysR family transcriptional regulator [Propionibacteriaceae bacterium]
MEVRHLFLLREIAVRGTLAAVAAATHRTPSAVSQQLRTAERELGVTLVEPVSRGLRLTAEGLLLAESADEVGRVIAEVEARLESRLGLPGGEVSIGTLPSAGEALLPLLMTRLRESAITVDVRDFDVAEAEFARETLDHDLVIAHSLTGDVPAGAGHLVCRVLAREPLDVALPAGHPLASRSVLAPGDLVGTTWIAVPVGFPFDSVLKAVEAATGTPLARRMRLVDNRLVESMVAAGEGLALLPRFTTAPNPGTVLRPLTGVNAQRAIVAIARPDHYARRAVRTVADLLAQVGSEVMDRHADLSRGPTARLQP